MSEDISLISELSRSDSDENISTCGISEGDAEALSRELLCALKPAQLSALRKTFTKTQCHRAAKIKIKLEKVLRESAAEEGVEFAPAETNAKYGLWIDEDTFVGALEKIFGHHKYTTHAHNLFNVLDPFSTGHISWNALLDRMVAVGALKTRSRVESWTDVRVTDMKQFTHSMRETIITMVGIQTSDSFCYAVVSKGGRVGLYSGQLELLYHYELWFHRKGITHRVKNAWVTDAVYMPDVQNLLLAASDRSLTIYDASTLTHTPIYTITGLPNIPTCLSYTSSRNRRDASSLMFGDERGFITTMTFLQPRLSLLYNNYADKINCYFWMKVESRTNIAVPVGTITPPHSCYIRSSPRILLTSARARCGGRLARERSIARLARERGALVQYELSSPPHSCYVRSSPPRRAHARAVRRLARGRGVLSCTRFHQESILSTTTPALGKEYVHNVTRGISCFHQSSDGQMLATGGPDGAVRLYSMQLQPFAVLQRCNAAVLDVMIVTESGIVIGYNNLCCVDIWDIYEECLLQTIKINFPFVGVLGKKLEFGTRSLHAGPPYKNTSDSSDEDSFSIHSLQSRRGSCVSRGHSGGFKLAVSAEDLEDYDTDHSQNTYIKEIIVTSCDYACVIELPGRHSDDGYMFSPPDTARPAKTPRDWNIEETELNSIKLASPKKVKPKRSPRNQDWSPRRAELLSPSTAILPKKPSTDFDELLEKSGLEGILEKDFVQMMGMKHDLNKKLSELEKAMRKMSGPIKAGAPYLALKLHEPVEIGPVNEMTDKYKEVMRLFPKLNSLESTPRSSRTSTSRTSKSTKKTKSSRNSLRSIERLMRL